ncbi:MAG: phytoene/squalene synthase family protein [Puniceicoccaceae bacterium]
MDQELFSAKPELFGIASPETLACLPGDIRLADPDPHWHRDPSLKASLRIVREITRHHAKSFYFASFHLPPFRRHAAYAVYAFCRYIDDCIDENPGSPPDRLALNEELDRLLSGSSSLPFAPAFAATVANFSISLGTLHQLIEGCCLDREPREVADFPELEHYCYYVASVVGLMMCPIFGLRTLAAIPQAVDMGIAMQLTNILRDVREDFEKGRVYLPADELRAAGLDLAAEVAAPSPSPAWRSFVLQWIERTRPYYRSGLQGLEALSPDGARQSTRTMAVVYSGILRAIESREGDNLSSRCYVSFPKKIQLALIARGKNPERIL